MAVNVGAAPRLALVAHWDWVLFNFRLPIAKLLREQGCDVTLICPRGEHVDKLRAAGFAWTEWHVSRRGLNPLAEAVSIWHLAWIYRRGRFDAVQHYTIKPIVYGSIAAAVARIPLVCNMFSGLGYMFSDTVKAKCMRMGVVPMLRRLLVRRGSYTQFQNVADRQHLVDAGLVDAQRAYVIEGSGVDTEFFAPADGGRPAGAPVVLMAARLLKSKGVGEMVDAARLLRARGVEARVQIAGAVDAGSHDAIDESQLASWRTEGIVEFLGQRSDMKALLAQASVAVLPSYYEGVPRFLLEAAACGLPLIGTDIEGCRLVIADGENGLIVPPANAPALAEALERLVRDASLRARLGLASRALAVARFDQKRILTEYLAFYRRIGLFSVAEAT